jgi:hypothetical protein
MCEARKAAKESGSGCYAVPRHTEHGAVLEHLAEAQESTSRLSQGHLVVQESIVHSRLVLMVEVRVNIYLRVVLAQVVVQEDCSFVQVRMADWGTWVAVQAV